MLSRQERPLPKIVVTMRYHGNATRYLAVGTVAVSWFRPSVVMLQYFVSVRFMIVQFFNQSKSKAAGITEDCFFLNLNVNADRVKELVHNHSGINRKLRRNGKIRSLGMPHCGCPLCFWTAPLVSAIMLLECPTEECHYAVGMPHWGVPLCA
jgi:hypothetical protein